MTEYRAMDHKHRPSGQHLNESLAVISCLNDTFRSKVMDRQESNADPGDIHRIGRNVGLHIKLPLHPSFTTLAPIHYRLAI